MSEWSHESFRSGCTVRDETCVSCGREIQWRKKWAKEWQHVKYCSAGCRGRGVGDTDRLLEEAIMTLLDARAAGATICPSEAARQVAADQQIEQWRDLMEPARRAARRLVDAGRVEITQAGHVVDPSSAKGPIRIRKVR